MKTLLIFFSLTQKRLRFVASLEPRFQATGHGVVRIYFHDVRRNTAPH